MKKQIFMTLLVLLGLSQTMKAQTWDFGNIPASDLENLEADNTGDWKYDATNERWGNLKKHENEAVTANGVELEYTKGLLLTFGSSTGDGSFRADNKNSRMWMGSGSVTIPNLAKGMKVTVKYMSSSTSVARGISVTNLTKADGSKFGTNNKGGQTKDALTDTGTVTEDGAVVLTMTTAQEGSFGMYVYIIKVEDPSDDEEGSDDTGGETTPTTSDLSTSANSMKNQAVLTLKDGTSKYYNTESLLSIDFENANVKVVKDAQTSYTFENTVAGISFNKAEKGESGTVVNVEGTVKITEARGWLESAYVKFEKLDGAKSYAVYVKGGQYADYTKIDNQLVRDYGTYGRADAVGLKAAEGYAIKVVPVDADGNEMAANANEATGLKVKSYSRQGFAFMNNYVPGAYKADGTLKANAKVLYITAKTAKTVSTEVINDKKGGKAKIVGFQAIIDAYQKGLDTTPIAFRFIGMIEKDDLDKISSSEEGIQIKGKNADAEMPLTIEGIGDDATVKGFGFLVRNSKGVEFRNIAVIRCMDDGISLDTDNSNIWIHHTDIFYGKSGSGDHGKGDGATDVKADSKYVTVSYNRYWDTGKTNMFGMKSESGPNYISYDHNWFYHSDSRHPRVRTMTVHVWNNYFDNVAKYGVGATTGSSVFVENNYFLKTKKPILSSLQGTDGMGSKGTFSDENGGMIKAYGNYMDKTAAHFSYYTQKNPSAKGYDAYETATRDEQVPATEKTLVGGTTYNNFDTNAALMYDYTVDAVENVPSIVTGYYGAGRMNHGDISYTIADNVGLDDTDSALDQGLASLIDGYKSSLVGFFDGNSSSGTGGDTGGGSETGSGSETGGGNTGGNTPEGTITCSFVKDGSTQSTSGFFTITGNYSKDKGTATVDGTEYTYCLKLETSTSVKFTLTASYKMTLYFASTETGNIKIDGTKKTSTTNTLEETLAAGEHTLTKADGRNLFYIKLEPVTE